MTIFCRNVQRSTEESEAPFCLPFAGMLDVFPSSFHFRSMKRKRIVVMGFMGSMPIAGVIWQHIHYIVGLQRLGHDVYYIEDSARIPLQPANL